MDSHLYLDLTGLPAVGALLLDRRPALVLRGDGRSLLWANPAAVGFFGTGKMDRLLGRPIAQTSRLREQVAQLTWRPSTETPRMEMLRFDLGIRQVVLAAACRKLALADGGTALLAVGAGDADAGGRPPPSFAACTGVFAGNNRLVAILDRSGGVLGASDGADDLAAKAADVAAMIAAVAGGGANPVRGTLRTGDAVRSAGLAGFTTGDQHFFLLIADLQDRAAEQDRPAATATTAPTRRFTWQVDRHQRMTFVSRELAEVVGPGNAAIVGARWAEVAERLALEPASTVTAALTAQQSWSGLTVYWPTDVGDRIAVELSGIPIVSRGHAFDGFRGFGMIHLNDRRKPPGRDNVVRLPGTPARALPRRLTGNERDAFRRIAEELGAYRAGEPDTQSAGDGNDTPRHARASVDIALLDRLPIGMTIAREDDTLYANRAILAMLGWDSFDAFAAAGGVLTIFPDRAAEPEGHGTRRLAAHRSDGSVLAVEATLHTVTWEGAPALMLLLAGSGAAAHRSRGVDAARSDATASAARIAELEAILDTATDGVVVIDAQGRIGTFNRAAEALFGVAADAVTGKPFTDLFAEESQTAAGDYLEGLASNAVASVLNDGREVIGKVPGGGLIPLFMTMGRLGRAGKYCAVLRDITHWKNVEDELVAARRAAEAANAQKSEFLARVSHEIRTPLNAIIGFSELMMEERFGAIDNERYRAYLRDIHTSGAHLMSLINDLLDLSKIEAGKLDLKPESIALNEVIRECAALMQPEANRERIIIRTSLPARLPAVVADLRSFRQILLNLLSNAIKFTDAGGQVIVSTAREEDGTVVVRIRDTGIGMSPGEIETALKPFRQVATSGRQRQGTGLGLPLTKALVEANQAMFSIDSAPDRGTLVRIAFPADRVLAG